MMKELQTERDEQQVSLFAKPLSQKRCVARMVVNARYAI